LVTAATAAAAECCQVFWQNTRYYAYGTWNSMKEYQAHFE